MEIRNRVNNIKKKVIKTFQKKVPIQIPTVFGTLLEGKTVMITGGGSGIGYSIAQACIRNGAEVIIAGRNREKLELAVKSLSNENGRNIGYVIMDIHNVDSLEESFIEALNKTFSKHIDILINNAGTQKGDVFGVTEKNSFDITMETNVRGTYFLSQLFSNYLIKNKKPGNILNICSSSGIRPAITPYMLSKWSEIGMTKGLAKKLIPYNVVVNAVAPGPTASGMLAKIADGNLTLESSPAKRYVTPEEVANLVLFLVSDMGRMIVGETICITGGCGTLTFDDIKY